MAAAGWVHHRMTEFTLPMWAVYQVLDTRLALAESLGFPEVSRLGQRRATLRRHLQRNLKKLIEGQSPLELHRRILSSPPARDVLELAVAPPQGSDLWREPLPLKLPILRWR